MNLRIQSADRQHVYLSESYPDEFYTGKGTEERSHTIDLPGGTTNARTILFNGVSITYGRFDIPHRLDLHAEIDKPVIEMHFTLEGQSRIIPGGMRNHLVKFDTNRHNLTFTPYFDGLMELSSTDGFRMFEVNFSRSYFQRIADSGSAILDRMLNAMERGEVAQAADHSLVITPAMLNVIHSIETSAYVGACQKLFLESKVLELFSLQLEQLERENNRGSRRRYTQHELNQLQEARQLLLADLSNPPTIAGLSQLTGINDFKLKQGFREVFGNTVFGVLTDARMETAYKKLEDGVMNINEVAAYVGYSNSSHFTVAFKRKYGFLPGRIKPATHIY
jgi:AraC-like DNA-binding protein